MGMPGSFASKDIKSQQDLYHKSSIFEIGFSSSNILQVSKGYTTADHCWKI